MSSLKLGLAVAAAAWAAAAAAAQPPTVTGRWLTEDRNGIIDIYDCGDAVCGRLFWFRPTPEDVGKPPFDRHNPEATLRSRPLCGLEMLGGFKAAEAGRWTGGWIYNPENGNTYHARMTLGDDGRLRLRGYVGIPLLGETQIWTRADPAVPACQAP